MGHLWFKWVGHLWLKWVGQSELLFFGWNVLKNAGLQGNSIPFQSSHMTTGFSPFELP